MENQLQIKKNNIAGRLYYVLDEVRKNSLDVPLYKVWSEVFGVNSNSFSEIFQNIENMGKLVDEIKEQVTNIKDINEELYLKPFKKIENVFNVRNLETNWKSYANHLDDTTMLGLAFCAEELAKQPNEPEIKEKELKELQKEVESLIESVISSKINEQLRSLILEKLEQIRNSLFNYRIFGIRSLKKSLESAIGFIFVHNQSFESESKKEVTSRFMQFVAKCNQVVSLSENIKQLGAPIVSQITKLLTDGN